MYNGYQPKTGFRFSVVDLLVIIACAIITISLRKSLGELALLFPITLGHFFLFCNVFRIHRNLEFIWAGLFIINIVAWSLASHLSWPNILTTQSPVTLIVILVSLCSSDYHGIATNLVKRLRAAGTQERYM